MNDQRHVREQDRWHVMRGIPVALLLGIGLQTAGFAWWLSALNSTVTQQGKDIAVISQRMETLSNTVQGSSVPSALQAARLTAIEQQLGELRSRDRDNDRRIGVLESRRRVP